MSGIDRLGFYWLGFDEKQVGAKIGPLTGSKNLVPTNFALRFGTNLVGTKIWDPIFEQSLVQTYFH